MPFRFYVDFHGSESDEYTLYVIERIDLDLFTVWKPEAVAISESDAADYAYWIPKQARGAGRQWRGGFPRRPDGKQSCPTRGNSAVAEKLTLAIEDGRMATAQLMDRWVRGKFPVPA